MGLFKIKYAMLSLSLLALPAMASWHTAQGVADLASQDIKDARDEAIDDALRSIILEAGANINLVQKTNDGKLVADSMQIKSASPIKQVTVLEEQKADNMLTVKVRAFVDDNMRVCNFAKVKKTVLPIAFRYEDNDAYQSSTGIEDINKEISALLYKNLSTSNNLNVRPLSHQNLRLNTTSSALTIDDNNNLKGAARQGQAQYVIVGSINSMSVSDSGNNILKQMIYKNTRRISFNVTVYDTLSDMILLNKGYSGEADWDFDQGEFIDIRSNRFLSSAYGHRLRQLVNYAVDDVISSLQCIAPSARVIDKEGDSIIINMGKSSGLKTGMTFNVSHLSTVTDNNGDKYDKYSDYDASYKVEKVYPHSAKLSPKDINSSLVNIALDDLVTLK